MSTAVRREWLPTWLPAEAQKTTGRLDALAREPGGVVSKRLRCAAVELIREGRSLESMGRPQTKLPHGVSD